MTPICKNLLWLMVSVSQITYHPSCHLAIYNWVENSAHEYMMCDAESDMHEYTSLNQPVPFFPPLWVLELQPSMLVHLS